MTRKRKARETPDESCIKEEARHEPQAETLFKEEKFISRVPATQEYDSQTMGGAAGTNKDTLQQPLGVTSTVTQTCDLGSGVASTEGVESNSNSVRNFKTTKRLRIPEEFRLKMITINCEWDVCTLQFSKMEHFISHIDDHLLAITGLC